MTQAARQLINLTLIACTLQSGIQHVMAQKHKAADNFNGAWTWTSYAKGKVFVPNGFDPKKDPYNMLALNLSQAGNKLTGKYINTVRFVAKIEDGDFSTVVEGDRAEIELESGFGGKVKFY